MVDEKDEDRAVRGRGGAGEASGVGPREGVSPKSRLNVKAAWRISHSLLQYSEF